MKFKNFASKSSAQNAIRRQGLVNVPHDIILSGGVFIPTFYPDLSEDFHELRNRGFNAEYNALRRAAFQSNAL